MRTRKCAHRNLTIKDFRKSTAKYKVFEKNTAPKITLFEWPRKGVQYGHEF